MVPRKILFASMAAMLCATTNIYAADACPVTSSSDMKAVLKKGASIYATNCGLCHAPAMASTLNAPPAHDAQAWGTFYTDACKTSTNKAACSAQALKDAATKLDPVTASCALLPIAKTGKTAKGVMPPKGNCATCTDQDLQSAIIFMLSKKPASGS